MSLDRTNSDKPYEDGSVRFLCVPLNHLRRESLDDTVLHELLTRIRGLKFVRVADQDAGVPGMTRKRRWLEGYEEEIEDTRDETDEEEVDEEQEADEDRRQGHYEEEEEEEDEDGQGGRTSLDWILGEFDDDDEIEGDDA
ncbi:hypothetical protein BDZ90DRAFT_188298 [Jaminaea rosea]|uniref:Uncharacterized protein n=1 Tax=Jaminaea rosea TaxID=1569628 RepID=A0A316UPK5_9BASI|nr:hypothetical protein BDZ90DRAFT_188298 [Jaminaea rosea]PWN27210.1 hypothetical protein BDZ90DRAFT_188298 [Jaminaea rosea]